MERQRDMIRLREILHAEHILLDVTAVTREEAVHRVAQALQGDPRVADWREFYNLLVQQQTRCQVNLGFGLALPHARTDAVTDMVMAFGRLSQPIEDGNGLVQCIFVIGIPKALDSEYLRLVGLLMRVFRKQNLRDALLRVRESTGVLDLLEEQETELKN
jgi:mannitol/fructose-specific phosphotransferase system IIA component (Ntr-type)